MYTDLAVGFLHLVMALSYTYIAAVPIDDASMHVRRASADESAPPSASASASSSEPLSPTSLSHAADASAFGTPPFPAAAAAAAAAATGGVVVRDGDDIDGGSVVVGSGDAQAALGASGMALSSDVVPSAEDEVCTFLGHLVSCCCFGRRVLAAWTTS